MKLNSIVLLLHQNCISLVLILTTFRYHDNPSIILATEFSSLKSCIHSCITFKNVKWDKKSKNNSSRQNVKEKVWGCCQHSSDRSAAFGPAYLMSDEISSSVVTLCSWHCSTGEQISRCAPNSSLSSSLTARSSSPAEVWDERLLPWPSCWLHYCLSLNLERVRDAELVFCGTPIRFQLQWNGFSSTFSF